MNHLPISAVIWAFTMSVLFRAFCVIFFHCSAALYLQHAITENDEQPSAKPFWRWQFPKFSRVFFRCLCFFFRPVILLRYSNNYDFTVFFFGTADTFFLFHYGKSVMLVRTKQQKCMKGWNFSLGQYASSGRLHSFAFTWP